MPEIRHEVAVQIRFISSGIESQKGTPTGNLCGDQDLVFEQDQIERVLLRNRFAKMDRARLRPPPITDSKMNRHSENTAPVQRQRSVKILPSGVSANTLQFLTNSLAGGSCAFSEAVAITIKTSVNKIWAQLRSAVIV